MKKAPKTVFHMENFALYEPTTTYTLIKCQQSADCKQTLVKCKQTADCKINFDKIQQIGTYNIVLS